MPGDVLWESLLKTGRLGWDDMRVSLESARVSATAPPTLATFRGGLAALSFAKAATNTVYFDLQLPHTWFPDTLIEPHVHWATPATSGVCRWELEYAWANFGEAFTASPTTVTTDATVSGAAYAHQITDLGSLDGTGKRLSSVIMCRLSRMGAASEDTLDDVAFALSVDFHILSYAGGGPTEYAGAV